jgi:two-component system, NarL family, nitrate/nitrite response regulator NarL
VEENVKIFIADESRMNCQLMATALRRSGCPFTVVDCAVDCAGVRNGLDVHEIQVAVISAHLKDGFDAGFGVTREVCANHPKTDVVMLLDSTDQSNVTQAFLAGASGILSRDESFEVLCKCILAVSQGQVWANSQELRTLLHALIQNRPISTGSTNKMGRPANSLTRREEGVVHLVAEGLTNRDISKHLQLSEHTVRNYLFRIYNKLGTSNRLELALYAIHRKKGDHVEHQ